ncbi:DNA-binding protein [Myxococcota bacterium]|nr:DNA-binding protein [Myxococcota bacterium]
MAKTSTLAAIAFLHAHGLSVDPGDLQTALAEAIARHRAVLHPVPGREGLTAPEEEVLREGGFDVTPRGIGPDDPLVRTTAEYAAILQSSLGTRDAAALLGVSDARIRQRLAGRRTLLGVETRRGWRLPSFQFTEAGEVPGWSEVVTEIPPGLSLVAVLRWFSTPDADLEAEDGSPRSPRDWLLAGGPPDAVARLARDLA